MLKTIPVCDICGEDIEVHIKHTPLGEIAITKSYSTKVINTRCIFTHLCKSCADNIDKILTEEKEAILKQNN